MIAAGDERIFQPPGQQPEPIAIRRVGWCAGGRVLPEDGHVQAVILAHREAGEIPVVAVGVDDLGVVQVPTALVHAPVVGCIGEVLRQRLAAVGDHLHQPDHPHLLGIPQAGAAGLVGHTGREGHSSAAGLIGDDVEGRVEQHVADLVFIPHGDAVGSERLRINHVVRVRVGDIAQGRTGRGVALCLQGDEVLAVG